MRAVDAGAGELEDAGFEAVAELGEAVDGAVVEGVHGEFGSLGETDDAGYVLSACALPPLVASADEQGLDGGSAADEHGADALGAVHLVGADGEQVAADAADVDLDFAGALNGIDMEESAGRGGDFADLFDGLEDAGFVVGEHDADEAGFGADGAENVVRVDEAAGLGRDEGGFDAETGHAVGCLEDGRVLDGGGDEVVAGVEEAEDGGVVALGAAGVEDHLGVMAVEEAAMVSRARSTAVRACWPCWWMEEALPKCSIQ